ncbi:MAG TPA: YjbF family lipoprotein [Xanthomonadaceae bacterium]|jgi:hypothetical protein
MRRHAATAILAVLLAGCSSIYGENLNAVRTALHGQQQVAPTAESVAAKPYFQLLAISPDGKGLMILGGVEGDLQGWYGHSGEGLFLDHGLVVRTIGLRQNLDDTHWSSGSPFAGGLQTLGPGFEGDRVVDWSPGYRYGITEHVRLVPARMEDVNILGTIHHLQRIDEHVSAPEAGFAADNQYWIDPSDGFIWKSHQVIAPGLPLDIVQLRPYRDGTP